MAHRPFALPIILLAAGSSSRMRGRDKLMEDVDGIPLLRRQAEVARAASTGPVLVTLPARPHPRYQALDGLDVVPVAVPNAESGMNASLSAGISALANNTPAAMVLLADLPDLSAQDLITVARAVDLSSETRIWRGATDTGAPGHPIIFAATLFQELKRLTGDSGGRDVVKRHADKITLIPLPGQRARNDLDTPEDWANWRATRS